MQIHLSRYLTGTAALTILVLVASGQIIDVNSPTREYIYFGAKTIAVKTPDISIKPVTRIDPAPVAGVDPTPWPSTIRSARNLHKPAEDAWYMVMREGGGAGLFQMLIIKSADKGASWTILDHGNSPALGNGPPSVTDAGAANGDGVVRIGSTIYVFYNADSAAPDPPDAELRCIEFDTATDSYGPIYKSGIRPEAANISGGGDLGAVGHQIISELQTGGQIRLIWTEYEQINSVDYIRIRSARFDPATNTYSAPFTVINSGVESRHDAPVQVLYDSTNQATHVFTYTTNTTTGPTVDNADFSHLSINDDDSGITYISDENVLDHEVALAFETAVVPTTVPDSDLNGNLYLPNGTRYRIDNSTVTTIRDRTGNQMSFLYDGQDRVKQVTDPLGRIVSFAYNPTSTVISYTGAGLGLIQTYGGLYPSLAPLMAGNLATTLFDPLVVSEVELPDGRKYEFRYNTYSEAAEIILPTGGKFEYDWQSGVPGSPSGVDGQQERIFRVVSERREYPDGTNLSLRQEFTRAQFEGTGCEIGASSVANSSTTEVLSWMGTGTGQLLAKEVHHFCGSINLQPRVGGLDPQGYPSWKHGRKFRTELFDLDQTTVLRTINESWDQRDPLVQPAEPLEPRWWGPSNDDGNPPSDPRLVSSSTMLENVLSSDNTFVYDEYNNRTDIYEFDYLLPEPSRRTHFEYEKSAEYVQAMIICTGNGANEICADETVHLLRNLVTQRLVCGFGMVNQVCALGDPSLEGRTDVIFDLNANLSDAPSIVGHDTATFGTGGKFERGNATEIQRYIDDSNFVSVKGEYDIAGNVKKLTDANTVSTDFVFADVGTCTNNTFAFPTTVTRATGTTVVQTLQGEYDYCLGAMTTLVDANLNQTTFEYGQGKLDQGTAGADGLDRMNKVVQAVESTAEETIQFEYDDTAPNPLIRTLRGQLVSTDRNLVSETVFDGYGRATQARLLEGGSTITSLTEYDALGRVFRSSNPTRGGTILWTTNTYDALGRVSRVVRPDLSDVNTIYTENLTTVTDEADTVRVSETDALGRLLRVVEDPPGPAGLNYSTRYTYDALDNLEAVLQSGQTRTFAYDGLSRTICASNPESRIGATSCANAVPSNPIAGVDWFTYDNNGNLLTKSDARAVTTTNAYDELNRVTSTSYSDGTPGVTFAYDTARVGQLDSITSSVSATQFNIYDALGRVQMSTQITDGVAFPFMYNYNADGSLKDETYPSMFALAFSYDPAGRLTKAEDPNNNIVFAETPGAADQAFWEHGAIKQLNLGNGLFQNSCFNNLLQPNSLRAGATADAGCAPSSTGLLQLDYAYDDGNNNGNIQSQTLHAPGLPSPLAQIYTYDPANRLKTVTEGGWSQTYAYDAFGNRAATGDNIFVDTPQSISDFEPTTNRLKSNFALYDAAGNQTVIKFPGNPTMSGSVAYDANNKQTLFCAGTELQCGMPATPTSDYHYDGQGNRVKKTTATPMETIIYAYDVFGKLAAEYSDNPQPAKGGISYRTTDHLGSTRLVTDALLGDAGDPDGDIITRRDFFPFGEIIPANSTFGDRQLVLDGQALTTYKGFNAMSQFPQQFTGQQRDNESGLDYFGARYYSAGLGRFTSPDAPLVDQFRASPQSWNLFSYVRNNPLRFRDPTGRKCVKTDDDETADDGQGKACKEVVEAKAQQTTIFAFPQIDPLLALALRSAAFRAERGIKTFVVTSVAAGSAVGGGLALSTGARLTQLGVAAGPAVPLVPQLGRKLDFLFGLAKGSIHNIQRSTSMLAQLRRVGLNDTPHVRAQVQAHFQRVVNDTSSIVSQSGGRTVRESFLMGPNGGVKLESIWEGTKLITVKVFGGG